MVTNKKRSPSVIRNCDRSLRTLILNKIMIQDFDAIAHELNHAADFSKSRSIQLEISSHHDYSEGITYFYLHSGDLELGHYYPSRFGSPRKSDFKSDCAPCDRLSRYEASYPKADGKNPWGDGWYWFSSISGEKNRCPNKAIALTKLQQTWMRWAS